MKPVTRQRLYVALSAFCLLFAAFIFFNGKDKSEFPELKTRQGALARDPEWPSVQAGYDKLIEALETSPDDKKNQLQLAKTFLQEGRVTGDFSYYNQAALLMIERVLAKDPVHLEAICLKATTYLSQHRFSEARELAEKARQINPYYSFVYGLLCDSYVELGLYPEAVAAADKMVNTRPDIRSYSRVSYLREIHGDVPGAIEAIQMAIAAGYPGAEDKCWARMVLAHLYEDNNALDKAQEQYETALVERPDYPFALAGLGNIARYRKDYPAAVNYLEKARDVMADVSFFETLIELYRLNGQSEKSEECARITLNALLADHLTASKNKDQGHYSDMELAQLYLKTNQPDKALEHARIEHSRRPENLDACEVLAEALFKSGNAAEAAPLMEKALRTRSQRPERLVLAGEIKKALGQTTEGEALIARGLALKPYMER
ncbi:MAG: tetratricopeptide repeat protein [Saprospiraceae bacterium]|nr:tetratricopeptide repeat protein [Saprospiraceae bacterium]